jgi:hypothetical protein
MPAAGIEQSGNAALACETGTASTTNLAITGTA